MPIGSYQEIKFPLACADVEIECASFMNRKAAGLIDNGQPFCSEASTAKLIASEAACRATDRAVQIPGGMGFASEFHVERLCPDARIFADALVPKDLILRFIATHDLHLP